MGKIKTKGWIPHTLWAQEMNFLDKEGNVDTGFALSMCSEKSDEQRFPLLVDRRDILKLSQKRYQVYYEPWNHTGQRYPRFVNRREWLIEHPVNRIKRKLAA